MHKFQIGNLEFDHNRPKRLSFKNREMSVYCEILVEDSKATVTSLISKRLFAELDEI